MSQINAGFEFIKEIIRKRWVPEILSSIGEGNNYYSDILKSIDYLSKTELNRKLDFLIQQKLVEKNTIEDTSRSLYHLSQLGEDIDHIMNHLSELGQQYIQ